MVLTGPVEEPAEGMLGVGGKPACLGLGKPRAFRAVGCQGAVFMAAKFEVFPTLSLKTFTHFAFSLRIY